MNPERPNAGELRDFARGIILATGDGYPTPRRRLAERLRLVAPKVVAVSSGRSIVCRSPSAALSINIGDPMPEDDKLRYADVEIEGGGHEPMRLSTRFMGIAGRTRIDPDRLDETMRALARIARIIAFGEEVGLDGGTIGFTDSTKRLLIIKSIVEQSLASSGYGSPTERVIVGCPAARIPPQVSYQGIERRMQPALEAQLTKIAPDSVSVMQVDGRCYVTPLNMATSLNGADAVAMLRIVSGIPEKNSRILEMEDRP